MARRMCIAMTQKNTYAFDVEGHTVVVREKKTKAIKECCPYCKNPMQWNQWSESWRCRDHGRFDVREAI
jgi:hypothetical protein